MVALGPGKFYGSSLPRPRIYTDIKYNTERVDPPVSVLDPLMAWAEEAHWSMGGLSFQRHRLQGRIEGSVEKLRNQIEKSIKIKESLNPSSPLKKQPTSNSGKKSKSKKKEIDLNLDLDRSPSPPPAPLANKRKRRFVGLVDEDEEEEEMVVRKWPVRKLSDEFERVASVKKSPASSSGEMETVASRTRGRKTVTEEPMKVVSKGNKRLRKVGEASPRSSPRLVKRG